MSVITYANFVVNVANGAEWDYYTGSSWITNSDPETMPTYAQYKAGLIRYTPVPVQSPFYELWVEPISGEIKAQAIGSTSPGEMWIPVTRLIIDGATLSVEYRVLGL